MEDAHLSNDWAEKTTQPRYTPSRPQGYIPLMQSANVFLSKNGPSKLGDMNVSKIAKNGLLYTQTGTPYYASP